MKKTAAVLVSVLAAGCGLYSGDDAPIDPAESVEGSWEMRVSLAPCIVAPAPATVTFEIEGGNLVTMSVAGENLDGFGYLPDEQVIWAETQDGDAWDIMIWDDGIVAGALIEWRTSSCDLETGPESVVRVRS